MYILDLVHAHTVLLSAKSSVLPEDLTHAVFDLQRRNRKPVSLYWLTRCNGLEVPSISFVQLRSRRHPKLGSRGSKMARK